MIPAMTLKQLKEETIRQQTQLKSKDKEILFLKRIAVNLAIIVIALCVYIALS